MSTKQSVFGAFLGAFLTIFGAAQATGQGLNLGVPPVWNFSKKAYKAGTQNWDAAQDSRGVMFWANNEGLLQFDGSHWACHPVANKTVVRSVEIDAAGRIFVGAQGELGYFFPEKNGCLRYHSLAHLLPTDGRNFEDVWDIVCLGSDVFFRTNRAVLQFSSGKIAVFEPGGDLTAMFSSPWGLLVQRGIDELLVFENGAFRLFAQSPELRSEVTSVLHAPGDSLLLSTLKNGLFSLSKQTLTRWETPHDALFREKRIYTAAVLPDGQIALGTSLNGLLVLDRQRRIFRHLTTKNGLQNNNILTAFADRTGNLWLGLDSGIDCAVLDAPFTSVIPDGELQGTGYAAAVFGQSLYLGVSNGVYRAPWNAFYNPEQGGFFQKIPLTDGQVWALDTAGGELLLGHHEGAFSLAGQAVARLSSEPGAWTFVRLSDDYLLAGTYSGVVLYRKVAEKWVFDQKLEGLRESCRFMVKDADGAVWVSHPYRGLYRILWSEAQKSILQVQFFNAQRGLPSDLNNFVFEVAGRAVFATQKGVFRFDQSAGRFLPDEDFKDVLGENAPVRYLREDPAGNIWYVADEEVGVLWLDDLGLKKTVRKRVFPELREKLVSGFERVFPLGARDVLFGTERGFIHFDAGRVWASDTVFQVVLHSVGASGVRDSLLCGGWFLNENGLSDSQNPRDWPVLELGLNNVRFVFAATDFKNPALLEYRFRLVGLSKAWSDWSPENAQNFTNLSPGRYTFEVQARRSDGRESVVLAFSFRIRPPWYASTLALACYALVFLGVFFSLFRRQKRRFESEKAELTVLHEQAVAEQQHQVEQSKAAISEILNDKLEAEIRFKNQELALATMHLVQKGEILLTIQAALDHILEKSTNPTLKKEVQQLLNLLNFDAQLDDDWAQFAVHFDRVHVDFLKRLRERFPHLSVNDHKLCAYLRMNLATKEIAPLMNISVRGVEASRYRLRKKLGLPNDANLTEAISAL
jgi:ligand-binding sensor domain-containing protein/DNA-binding CsgD family transcriptional regulator